MTRNGIVHLDCWRTKILPLLGVLSALIFILWCFCPMVLLSIGAFLCAPTWCWLSTPGVIVITWPEMGLYTLIVGVLKYCLFWGFCPLWFLSFGAFVLWCFLSIWGFSLWAPVMLIVHTWCDHDHMTRNGIVHLDCWRTKILPLLGVLSALIFILWGFCPMVLLSIGDFLCAPTWCWLSTPGVIVITWPEMGLYTLIVGVLKYCLFWAFCPLWFLSFRAFVLWCFCPFGAFLCAPTWCWLSTNVVIVITWPEMWLYTLIVGALKYCLFCAFCPLWFFSFMAFVLWCFCPLGLFSVRPRDVDCPHLLWSWSHDQKWDCTPWLLAY